MLKKKIKLLIIDDEKDVCEFQKSFFSRRNLDAYTAHTATEALAIAKRVAPDIAIIDIHMAKLSGIGILKSLLKDHPQCKCIMITWDKEKAPQAKRIGAVDFLIKPVELEELENSVNKVIKAL